MASLGARLEAASAGVFGIVSLPWAADGETATAPGCAACDDGCTAAEAALGDLAADTVLGVADGAVRTLGDLDACAARRRAALSAGAAALHVAAARAFHAGAARARMCARDRRGDGGDGAADADESPRLAREFDVAAGWLEGCARLCADRACNVLSQLQTADAAGASPPLPAPASGAIAAACESPFATAAASTVAAASAATVVPPRVCAAALIHAHAMHLGRVGAVRLRSGDARGAAVVLRSGARLLGAICHMWGDSQIAYDVGRARRAFDLRAACASGAR